MDQVLREGESSNGSPVSYFIGLWLRGSDVGDINIEENLTTTAKIQPFKIQTHKTAN